MARPRSTLVSIEDTPFYHCISKCVRQSWLTGVDKFTGKSYEHRRDWVESRILELAEVFAIDVAAYAVMSNHLHLVLRVDIFEANSWTDKEVVQHWHQLFKGSDITQRFAQGDVIESFEVSGLKHSIAQYRSRLSDISWFMRALNEPIARRANKEDGCTGRFWEGRFKSQALLDEAAVIACMAYVDLNPIRAKVSGTPETSDFTSIKKRIKAAIKGEQPAALLPFVGNERKEMVKGLMFSAKDYLQLVDETGRIIRADKRGAISPESQKILNRLNIPQENWLKLTTEFSRLFKGPVGTPQELDVYCEHLERKRRQGAANCQRWLCSS
ncbi:transposase [Shewanella eurypsychrophilus]|uniref:Transposase n=1 Tax=Shewanella eurypsychrophilus TaxID=2593656 RepID=A0ABX6V8D0_9GAMM|nr:MULTISPECIES: transposase [Shewanella]QFU23552.1 transposase [Shewanella sp. YLB-09]QPG58778.1 transposase [Shewanella eurypsychrophilus]